ncbi:hypothetical protein AB0D61_12895, partial [Streptomyces sp. NPDC048341]
MDSGRSGRGRPGGRVGSLGADIVRRRQRPPPDAATLVDGVAVNAESIPVPIPVPFAAADGPEFTGPGDAEAPTDSRAQADPGRTAGADRHPDGAPPNDPGSPAAGAHADHEAGTSPHPDAQPVRDPAPAVPCDDTSDPAPAVPCDDAAESASVVSRGDAAGCASVVSCGDA